MNLVANREEGWPLERLRQPYQATLSILPRLNVPGGMVADRHRLASSTSSLGTVPVVVEAVWISVRVSGDALQGLFEEPSGKLQSIRTSYFTWI
eukprot:3302469-Pyramimonas_sp.AAC.1